jgi:hypothetical protein
MLISYAPALPLGTEGKAERFEFKAAYHFDEQGFVRRLNRYSGQGIRFSSLRTLTESDLSLNERIKGMVYSVDLGNPDVKKAVETGMLETQRPGDDDQEFILEKMSEFWRQNSDALLSFWLDKKKKRLFLSLPHSPRRGLRAQDIVERVFGLSYPSFYLTRERFILQGKDGDLSEQEPPAIN